MIHNIASRKHPSSAVGLAVVMIAASATAVEAQSSRPFERGHRLVNLAVGQQFSVQENENESEGSESEEGEGLTFGGSYQHFLTPRVSLEAAVHYSPSSGEIEGGSDDDGENGENGDNGNNGADDGEDGDAGRVNVLYVTGGINYYLRSGGRFIPYVTAGGGVVSVRATGAGTSAKPAGMVGAGVLFAVTDSLLLRADLRDYLYSGANLGATAVAPSGSGSMTNDLSWTGGISWRF